MAYEKWIKLVGGLRFDSLLGQAKFQNVDDNWERLEFNCWSRALNDVEIESE